MNKYLKSQYLFGTWISCSESQILQLYQSKICLILVRINTSRNRHDMKASNANDIACCFINSFRDIISTLWNCLITTNGRMFERENRRFTKQKQTKIHADQINNTHKINRVKNKTKLSSIQCWTLHERCMSLSEPKRQIVSKRYNLLDWILDKFRWRKVQVSSYFLSYNWSIFCYFESRYSNNK